MCHPQSMTGARHGLCIDLPPNHHPSQWQPLESNRNVLSWLGHDGLVLYHQLQHLAQETTRPNIRGIPEIAVCRILMFIYHLLYAVNHISYTIYSKLELQNMLGSSCLCGLFGPYIQEFIGASGFARCGSAWCGQRLPEHQ